MKVLIDLSKANVDLRREIGNSVEDEDVLLFLAQDQNSAVRLAV